MRRKCRIYISFVPVIALSVGGCCKLNSEEAERLRQYFGDGTRFNDYSTELARWKEIARASELEKSKLPPGCYGFMKTGTCDRGKKYFLDGSTGFSGTTLFYDAESGKFTSLMAWTDSIDNICYGRKYWPSETWYRDRVFTEVICNSRK